MGTAIEIRNVAHKMKSLVPVGRFLNIVLE
jgi:hypothetical protein